MFTARLSLEITPLRPLTRVPEDSPPLAKLTPLKPPAISPAFRMMALVPLTWTAVSSAVISPLRKFLTTSRSPSSCKVAVSPVVAAEPAFFRTTRSSAKVRTGAPSTVVESPALMAKTSPSFSLVRGVSSPSGMTVTSAERPKAFLTDPDRKWSRLKGWDTGLLLV